MPATGNLLLTNMQAYNINHRDIKCVLDPTSTL